MPARKAHGAGVEVDRELALAQNALLDLALGHRREDVDPALGELGADRTIAVGSVAEDPLRALFWRLAVPFLSTSGETLTIEESLTLRARTENAGHAGDEHERSWSWSSG